MTTYSKETALYDTGAIGNGIDAAGETASKYITYVDSEHGIRVYDGNNEIVGNPGNYAQLNSYGMQIYRNDEEIANFGNTTCIGKVNEAHTEILPDKFYIKNAQQLPMFNVGIGSDEISAYAIDNGGSAAGSLTITLHDTPINGSSIGVNGSAQDGWDGDWAFTAGTSSSTQRTNCTIAYNSSKNTISMTNIDANKTVTINKISYQVHTNPPKLSFGGLAEENGNWSASFGEGTIAKGSSQFVVGEYNDIDTSGVYEFIVGNGSGEYARNNAFAVGTNGDAYAYNDFDVGNSLHVEGDAYVNNGLYVSNVTVSGSVTASGHSSPIGTIDSATNTKSISTGTSYITSGISFSLTSGTYILIGEAEFASNSTGRRALVWQQSGILAHTEVNQMAVSSAVTRVQSVCIAQPSSTLTYTLYAAQNSGSSLSTKFSARYVRIA